MLFLNIFDDIFSKENSIGFFCRWYDGGKQYCISSYFFHKRQLYTGPKDESHFYSQLGE